MGDDAVTIIPHWTWIRASLERKKIGMLLVPSQISIYAGNINNFPPANHHKPLTQ
jgi:hypothetical protein